MNTRPQSITWHADSVEKVFTILESSQDGLSEEEVNNRLLAFGENRLPELKTRSLLIRFLYQFHNLLIYVLIVAGLITATLGHWVDAGVIFTVVFINAVIGFVQEGKAENALKAIRKMLSPNAMVVRESK